MTEPGPKTGIPAVDDALTADDPVPALRGYFRRRLAEAGREAVLAELTIARDAMTAGSVGHDGFSGWLGALERGENPFGARGQGDD